MPTPRPDNASRAKLEAERNQLAVMIARERRADMRDVLVTRHMEITERLLTMEEVRTLPVLTHADVADALVRRGMARERAGSVAADLLTCVELDGDEAAARIIAAVL